MFKAPERYEKITCLVKFNIQTHPIFSADLQSDAFRDDTPTLPPSSAPAFN